MYVPHARAVASPYQALHSATESPMAASSADSPEDTSGGSSSTSEASITANDFLTLLVSEMKNQDPTSSTDPNEYIDQLVQVNSLEQLIQINTDLGGSSSGSSSSDSVSGSGNGETASHAMKGNLGVSDSGLDAGKIATALGQSSGAHAEASSESAAGEQSGVTSGTVLGGLPAIPSPAGDFSSASAAGAEKRNPVSGRNVLSTRFMQR